MRRYETIFILDPDLSDDQRDPVFERVTDLINRHEGFLVVVDKWGPKKLAYEIKKKPRGYYVRLDFCGTGLLVDEIERFFRIDDRVLKYMTILMEKIFPFELIFEMHLKVKLPKYLHLLYSTTQQLHYHLANILEKTLCQPRHLSKEASLLLCLY